MIKIGDKVDGRYRIQSRIATGGTADVYEANDLVRKQIVCLKVMRSDLLDDPKNFERFENEADAAASLNDPHIVRVYSRGMIEGRPFLASEYVSGQTLREKLNFQGSLAVPEACEVMLQLTNGIHYIHKHGILHRDIKPDNLFYLADGTLKITDFGIASPIGAKSSGDSIQGTVFYCAPEIFQTGEAQVASDVYSMGIVFYEILTGKVPFDGGTPEEVAYKVINRRMPEASKSMPSVPRSLDLIIIKATRKRPEERYQSALAMHDDIMKAMSDKEHFKERKSLFQRLFGFK